MDSFVSIFTTQWGNIVRWWNGILDNLANVLVGLAVCLLLCFLSKKLAHWVSRGLSRLFRKWPTVGTGHLHLPAGPAARLPDYARHLCPV